MAISESLLKEFRKSCDFDLQSKEEIEIRKLFPEMDLMDMTELSLCYGFWKRSIDTNRELFFQDFIKDVTGIKKLKRKVVSMSETKIIIRKSLTT